ncbi:putative glycoside hydrolase [Paenibacillus sp. TRM 82003]|nr:putative glycoside hydrolase [Paenibacillus sp. TRM 82003]
MIAATGTACTGGEGRNNAEMEQKQVQPSPSPYVSFNERYGHQQNQTEGTPPAPSQPVPPEVQKEEASEPSQQPHEGMIAAKVKRDVKGVYVSAYSLRGRKWEAIQSLLSRTELNAVVIDVKNDSGRITYPTDVVTAKELQADRGAKVQDITPLLQELKKKNVYTIARIVTFKDPYLAAKKPDWAMKRKEGGVWRDKRGVSWVDPYNEEVWAYTIDLAKEAVAKGFDEIQFDYVRFPENGKVIDREVAFNNPKQETKDEIISRFLERAGQEIHGAGGVVAADVFGLTTTARDGMGIGQKWELIAQKTNVISPMIYPSHYAKGSYGVRYPDLQPYKILSEAAKDANQRNAALKSKSPEVARIRPWIQDFTAKWISPHQTYKRSEVEEQIRALRDQGINQYLLWNPSCNYSL